MSLESFVLDIIEQRTTRPRIEKLLFGLSFFYRAAIGVRNFCYDKSLLGVHSIPAAVVSIGNIVTGGTGKTPLIQMLCKELGSQKVAIVTRGFRSSLEKTKETKEISRGQGPLFPVEECGDESYWLALHTSASVWVGKDKVASAKKAFERGAEIVLVDDGMQHRRLKRDVEIVVLDGKDLFAKGFYLPRGLLRDSPQRLKCADYLVVNHVTDKKSFEEVKNKLKTFSKAPLIATRPKYFLDEKAKGKKVGIFCGIAKPHHFTDAVQKTGCSIVGHLFTLDHIVPSSDELRAFAKKCEEKGAEFLVCTEKDWVKIKDYTNKDLPVVPLQMQLEIVEGKEAWQELTEKITGKKQ